MPKPHEETLEHDGKGAVWVKGSLAGLRHEMPKGHACTPDEVEAYGALFAAAPEMARALLESGAVIVVGYAGTQEWHMDECSGGIRCVDICARRRTLLTKAGVLP